MLTIGLAQIHIHAGNPRYNLTIMQQYIQHAKEENCDIIIFPELAIPGYFIGDLWEQTDFINESIACGEEIRKAANGIIIIFGNVAIDENKKQHDNRLRKYNAMFIAQNQSFIGPSRSPYPFYIKTLLPDYREFSDPRHFTSLIQVAQEEHCTIYDLLSPIKLNTSSPHPLRVGPLICEDSWDDAYQVKPMLNLQQEAPIDLFVNISNSPFTIGKTKKRHELFHEKLNMLHTPAVYVNVTGIQNNGKNVYTFDGSSSAYNQDGTPVYTCKTFTDELAILQYDEVNHQFIPPSGYIQKNNTSEITSIYEALHYGIHTFLTTMGIEKVVIGISGGIDSAVNAALYARVLKPENILLVNMPSQYNSDLTQNLSQQLADNLQCPYAIVPIQDSVELTCRQIQDIQNNQPRAAAAKFQLTDAVLENIQARDRSSRVLAGIAAAFGGVFTCNANKAECTVGYATLYGDSAGFLAATADLWKHQVYDLAHYLNDKVYKKEVIPQEIIDLVPSAELSAQQDITKGQGDPLCYPYHDYLFAAFIEKWNRATPETILNHYAKGTLEEYLGCPITIHSIFPNAAAFITDLEYWWKRFSGLGVAKRIQSPPILSVSRRSFGFDLRESQLTPYYSQAYLHLKEKLLTSQK